MRPIVCVGTSHMACFLHAAEQAKVPVEAIAFKERARFEGLERQPLTLNARKLTPEVLSMIAGGGKVLSFVGGNHALALRRHPVPFDFVLASAPDVPVEDDAEIIPLEAMRAVVGRAVAGNLETLEHVVAAARGPVYQFEAPPPPRQRFLGRLLKEPKKAHSKPVRQSKPVPPPMASLLRYKLWRLHSEVVREHAERCGARFLAHPPEAVDEEGFMRLELVANATHGNVAYGALLLQQVAALDE